MCKRAEGEEIMQYIFLHEPAPGQDENQISFSKVMLGTMARGDEEERIVFRLCQECALLVGRDWNLVPS